MSSVTDSSTARTKALAEVVFSSARTDLSLYLKNHLCGTGEEIVSAFLSPMDYGSADCFSRDYLCVELMSKFPMWDLGIDRAGVALEKFRSAEAQCALANRRLIDLGANSLITVSCERILLSARRKIHSLLGPFSWLEVTAASRFGPGATFGKSRRHRDLMYKVADPSPSCTAGLLPYLYLLREEFPLWDFEPRIVAGGRVTTVPKSAKTDRLICIEPDLNVLVQLGIGKALRRRLRRVGLLFSDAQLRNQRGAEEGSSLGQLATVDLSSASDTISSELVRALIPSDWLEALEASRSPVALVKGNSKPLNKFSAMGCGYTFELETLIFWAISSVLVQLKPEWDQRVLVYGDDIIVDRRVVPQLAEVFEEVGFTLNPKKTFSDGPFRESCGRHYFRGVDVTPFYVREVLEGQKWCWAANTVRRYSRLAWGLDSRWKPVYDFCISNLPSAFHVLIPDGYGDGGLISDFDEATPSIAPGGQQGYVYSAFADLAVLGNRGGFRRLRKSLWLLERSLQGVQLGRVKTQVCFRPDAVGSSTSVRHRVRKLTGLVAAQWPSYGPWL